MSVVVACLVVPMPAEAVESATVGEERSGPHREHSTNYDTGAEQQRPLT